MKKFLTKILPIVLIVALMLTLTACNLSKLWGYVTGESIGSFNGDDNSDVVYNQGTIEVSPNPLADTIEVVMPSVVDVTCTATYIPSFGNSLLDEMTGSGVIVDEDDDYIYILGSYQSMYFPERAYGENRKLYTLNGVQARVTFFDGVVLDATFVAFFEEVDSGLVKVEKAMVSSQYSIAKLPEIYNVLDGEDVIAVSNPLGVLGGTVTTGIVSAKRNMVMSSNITMKVLQTDAELTVDSGGILFSSQGELLAIVYAKAVGEGIEGLTFAIPIDDILVAYHSEGFLESLVIGV